MMELEITDLAEIKGIRIINFEKLKEEIGTKISFYSNMVYTDDQIKEAKADKAKLNKLVTAIEDKRKEVKKYCLKPYEDFEKQAKELVDIIKEPIGIIGERIDQAEEERKVKKLEGIRSLFNEKTELRGLQDIPFDKILQNKWMNASCSMSAVDKEMTDKLEEVRLNIETLKKLPNFSFEAIKKYTDTVDMAEALRLVETLENMAKAKAEHAERIEKQRQEQQAKIKEQEQEAKIEEQERKEEIAQPQICEEVPAVKRQWINFSVNLSVAEAHQLKQFFEDRNIEFKKL